MSLRPPRLSLAAWVAVSVVVVAAALAAEWLGGPEMPERVGDLAAGLALLGGGAVAWARRPQAGAPPLMLLSGVVWFAGDAWGALLFAWRGPLVHLLLTYPSGRVSSRAAAAVIALAYVDGFVAELARSEWVTLALVVAVLAVAIGRHQAVAGVERRARAAPLAGTFLLFAALGFAALGRLLDSGSDAVAVWALYTATVLIAVGLTADLLWGRWARAALTGFVIDLGDHYEPQALRATLSRLLGDPDLEVAYRLRGRPGWVDEAGRPLKLPPGDGGGARAVTIVGEPGAPVAALVHDRDALVEADLAAGVTAAVRLALANVDLQADMAGRVREVDDSRRRLVEAGDAERRRLGERLATGPESKLAAVAERLERLAGASDGEARVALRALADQVADARVQLRDFAQGVRPRSLAGGGLRVALTELTRNSELAVRVDAPRMRFPPAHELVAYFVCSEALANVAKHAEASAVEIAVVSTDNALRIGVHDDGRGGADPEGGSGLRGLRDRVEALGGRLSVSTPARGGTSVEAVLPLARPS